jgi:hypothetical protein
MLRQLPWLALQAFFIVGALLVDAVIPGKDPQPGAALFIGIALAFAATAITVSWIECYKAFRRWLSKPARVDPVVPEPLDHRVSWSAAGNGRPRIVEHGSGRLPDRGRA